MRKLLIFLSLFCFVILSACAPTENTATTSDSENQDVFTLGFIPSENASELSPKAEALAAFLEEKMQMEVEIYIPTDYEPLIEGLRFNHIDASYMDSGPAYLATQQANAEIVLAELNDGQAHYFGELFVRSDETEINDLPDLLNKKIAFTSWTGSSGFIFPIGTMVSEGLITPKGSDFIALEEAVAAAFESYTISGGYTQSLDLLLSGEVDVIGGAHDAAERFLAPEDQNKIKSIKRLGKVPSHPILVRADLPSDVREKFVNAMMELNQPDNVEIIKNLYGVDGLTTTTTAEHMGDFGPLFSNLTGIQEKVLNK